MLSIFKVLYLIQYCKLKILRRIIYDGNHPLYDAALLTKCYNQHALHPSIGCETSHKRHFAIFDFDIVIFPFFYGDGPRSGSASYGVYISQLIRFARVSSHVTD